MAEPFLWGSQINLPSLVEAPHVTALSNGTFLVIGKTDARTQNVKMRAWIYNADGTLKEEKIVDSPAYGPPFGDRPLTDGATSPFAVELPDGRIALTWTIATTAPGHFGAWLGLYGSDLQPLGKPLPIAGLETDPRSVPGFFKADDAIGLADGRIIVTYRSLGGEAFLRVLNSDGTLSTPSKLGPTLATDNDKGFGSVGDLAVLSNGKIIAAFRASSSENKVYVLDPSAIDDPAARKEISIPVVAEVGMTPLQVTALEGGRFVVTWTESGRIDGSGSEPEKTARYQVFDAEGEITPEPLAFYATLEEAEAVGTPDVVALPGGGFALAAQVVTNTSANASEVRFAIFNAEGQRVSEKLLVSQPAAQGSFSLMGLVLLADGRIAVHLSSGIQIVDPRTEAVYLTGTSRDDQYIGTAFNDTLAGGAGDDILWGGDGRNILIGGAGNDTYKANASDVIEDSAGSNDTVMLISGDRYTMAAGIETLIIAAGLQGVSATGNDLKNTMTGNRYGNTLDGSAGADTLDGGDGFDFASYASMASGITVNLAAGANTDGDTFISIEGVIGSGFADTFIGNGSSTLKAGGGDDTYTLKSGDVVEEAANEGRDTVIVDGSYALKADAHIEVLRLSGISSKTSANLTGSDTANEILGHGGTNTLRGLSGNDVLKASSGNDTLKGDAGSDKLYGGLGNDKLYGGTGSGKDVFVFDTKLSNTKNMDRIYDFNTKYDSFQLENKIFTKLGKDSSKGVKFKSDMFVKSKAAQDREDRIIYDKDTGALYYDKDGTGSTAQIKIAILNKNLKIYFHDFYVI